VKDREDEHAIESTDKGSASGQQAMTIINIIFDVQADSAQQSPEH
jgi:hypothetical protein